MLVKELTVKIVKISKDSWSRDSADVLLTSLETCIMSIVAVSYQGGWVGKK